MVSILVWTTSMLKVSKALPRLPNAAFYPRKVSRISLTSVSSSSQSRYAGEDKEGHGNVGKEAMKEGLEATKQSAEEMKAGMDDMESRTGARDLGDITKETARNVSGKTKEATEQGSERMQGMKNDAKQKAWETTERAKESMHDTKEGAMEAAAETKERVEGAAGWTADKAKEGTEGVGEAVKGTVQGTWDAAKGATKKIKETVVGKSEDEKTPEELMEDHLNKGGKPRTGDDPNRKIY